MELSELSFKVNTEQLAAAVSLLGQVEQATNRLAVAQKNQSTAATSASGAIDTQAEAIKKLDTSQNETSQGSDKLQKSTKATASAADALGKSTEEASSKLKKLKKDSDDASDSVDPLAKLIQNLKDKHLDLSRGFTSGESSVLKQARSYGALGDSLLPVITELENIRKLSPNPFDAALGGVRSITSEFDKLSQRTRLAAEGISLTDKQLSEYSRLANEISGKVIGMGLDPKAGEGLAIYNKELADSQTTYISLAKSVNAATEAERQLNTERRKAEREKITADREAEKARLKAEQDLVKSQENAQSALIDSLNRVSGLKAKAEQADAKLAIQVAKDTAREQALIREQVAMNNTAAMKQRISSLYSTPLTSASSENKLQAISDQGGYVERMQAMRAFYTEQDKLMKASQGMNDQAVALFYKNQAVQSKASDAVTKSLREQERATKWLANEDERMVSVVNTLTTTQNLSNAASEKAARSIANYERNLRQAGVTGVEAAKSLDNYRKQQELIQTQEESRKGKFLSRALQPQIGDVVVSLAAGQNPLTVMLQQGDQVRGLIAQSGIEGTKLSAIMRAAFTDTLVSVKDTAKAMSQVLGGAFLSVGKLVTDLAVGPIKAFTTSLEFSKAYGDSGPIAFLYAMKNSVAALGASFAAFSTAGIVAAVAGLATLGVALYQVTKQEDEVSRVMALHGGAMGLTRGSAVALAQSFNGLGVSTYKALDALSEMATVGGFVQADAQKVVEAAVKMEKAGGPAIAETIKMFSSIKEKPVEALIKLGETSGLIAPQILEEVSKLSITGHMGDAIALALDTAVGVVKKQTAEMTRELSAFGTLLKDIGNAWTTLMDKFRGAMYKDDAITTLQDKITALKSANNWSVGSTSNNNSTITNLEEQLKLMKRAQNAEYDRNQESLAYNSRQSTLVKDKERLAKWLDSEEDKIGKKKLSREDFIAKALEDQVKLRGQLKDLTEQEQASIKRVAGLSFDKLHEKDNKSGESKYQTQLKAALGLTDSAMNKNEGLLSETTKFYEAVNFLRNKARKEDRISADTEQAMLDAFLNRQPFMIAARKDEADAAKQQADGLKLIDSLIGKADFMGSAYYETLKKLNDLEGKPGIDVDKLKEARAALEETTPSAKAFASVMAEYTKSIAEVNATSVNLKSQYSTDFILPDNKAKLKAQEEYLKKVQIINAEYDKKIEYNKAHIDELRRDKANAGAKDEADVKKRLAQETYDREVYLVSESYKVNKEYSDQIIKLGQDVSTQLTNQFMDFAMFGKSSFEGLAVSFDKMINNMINNLLRFHAQQKMQGILDAGITAGLDAVGLSSGVSAASTLGTASNVSSGMSMLNNAGAWVTDFGSSVAKAMGSAGDKFYSLGLEKLGLAMGAGSTGAMSVATSGSSLAAMGGGTGLTLGAAGTTGLTLGGGAGGVGLQGVAAGTTGAATSTFSTMASYAETAGEIFGYLNTAMLAGSGKWGAAIGAGLGTYFGGPLGSFIGGKIGGWVDNAFGGGSEYTTSQGISGKFSKNGFQGRNYQDWKNDGSSGFFGIGASGGSSGTNYSAMDTALQDKLSAAFTAIQIQTAGFAGALGANADSILNYTQDIKLALGSDASANKTAIENLFKDIANNTASTVLDPKYIKEGETATDALTRLATSLSQVNKVTTLLGGTLLQLSQMSADSADKLITLMGGQAAFTSAMDSYYTTYYTEEERLAQSKADVTKELAKLNLVMPDTLVGYKNLVNSQDKTTESGRQAYAALIKLSPEFAKFTSAVDTLQTSSVSAAKSIKALIDSISVERANVATAMTSISPKDPMTAKQIKDAVVSANITSPELAGVTSAKDALAKASAVFDWANGRASITANAANILGNATASNNNAAGVVTQKANALNSTPQTMWEHYTYNTFWGDRGGDRQVANPAYDSALTAYQSAMQDYTQKNQYLGSLYANGTANTASQNPAAQAQLASAAAAKASAEKLVVDRQIAYNDAVKKFTVDAATSVKTLGKLREETVKYYESQKALSTLMITSATNLRNAVQTARFGQLDSKQSLLQQKGTFDAAYNQALTSSGSIQAGFADKLTAVIPALSTALADTASTRAEWAIATSDLFARSSSIASALEASAPRDYQLESINLLNQIDSSLGSIGDATEIISNAIKAGAGLTAAGLREVVTALGGTPAFATGGMHSGGLRLVGENGPELEVTGPSRIFNADQTRSMLSSNRGNSMDTSRLEALVEKQANQLEAMRYELQAIATSSGKTANILQRVTPDGNSLQTAVAV